MRVISTKTTALAAITILSVAVPGTAVAQDEPIEGEVLTTVYGSPPADLSGLTEGPKFEGFISARSGDKMQVTTADGTGTVISLSDGTDIKASNGLFGINRKELGAESLLNGLLVKVETVEWAGQLVASQVRFKAKDLKTAAMIRNGTVQRFDEQGAAIGQNAAATEALRGRLGDIDKYNIKGTTNVFFDTNKYRLSSEAKDRLCATAAEADATDNALLLVVGYTDSTGSQEVNQRLSEQRAGGVVNYLQQACGWKPYRMLTPTGMASADPLADNSTPEGKAQNRRVSVNILVSKGVDGI